MTVGLRETMPRFVAPMLLAAADGVPDDDGWALEVKWDGMRAQARIEHGQLRVRSRRGVEWTQQFPELADLPPGAPDRSLLLDCELVCFGATGHPDFARLRGRLVRSGSQAGRAVQSAPATLIVFDVLHLDGRAVRRLPYSQRRRLLAELALDGEHWRTPRAYRAGRDDLAGVTREHGLEGVVAKRLSARTWRVAVPRARGASSNTVTSKRSSSPPGSGASDEATSCSSRGAIPTRASYATPAAFPCA
jgi:bifunctional non-homologous end joining protein LigD